jgi:hypothetical protein
MSGTMTQDPLAHFEAAEHDPDDELQRIVAATLQPGTTLPPLRARSLFYVRQVAEGPPAWVPLWVPEFVFLLDLGFPDFPLVSIPYQIPLVQDPSDPSRTYPIGLGAPTFPDFARATVTSAAGLAPRDILFPHVVGRLLVGARPGVPEPEVRAALAPHVISLTNIGNCYSAVVAAFREREVAARIEAEVSIVRYAVPNNIVRNNDHPWRIDRVV